ncbi:MAG: hypothetical protein ACR2OU_18015 [Thermomicrobiales bacterium]
MSFQYDYKKSPGHGVVTSFRQRVGPKSRKLSERGASKSDLSTSLEVTGKMRDDNKA